MTHRQGPCAAEVRGKGLPCALTLAIGAQDSGRAYLPGRQPPGDGQI